MYFSPWSSSSFPISSETGRGLTSISLPGLTICNPPNKLWLLLASFLLEIFCFTLYKYRSELHCSLKNPYAPRSRPQCVPSVKIPSYFRQQVGKQGKHSPCSPTFKIYKITKFPQISQPSVLTARKANAIPL